MKEFIDYLREEGSDLVLEIEASAIEVGAWTVMKCRYGCPNYGRKICCPPATPSWRETAEVIACYRRALLFRTRTMARGTELAVDCALRLARAGYYKAVAYGVGPCNLCQECPASGICCHPERMAPSAEACGIDLIATVRSQGVEMNAAPAPGEPLSCWGLILVD